MATKEEVAAIRSRLKELGLSTGKVNKIKRALSVLVDFEGPIKNFGYEVVSKEGGMSSNFNHSHSDVCAALRELADTWDFVN